MTNARLHPRSRRSKLIAAGLGWVVIAGTAPATPANAQVSAATAEPVTRVAAPLTDERSAASARARISNEPVEVTSLTTPTARTVANPDGTFTVTVNPLPARTKRASGWVDLNANLQHNPDGTYSPIASANGLALSGGGTAAALATMSNGDSRLGLRWPTALPTPTVSGAKATYANVFSGVDLVVTADEQGGFSHVLVIRNATAGANPALRNLTLPMVTQNATVSANASGELTAVDQYGREVFSAPTPRIWDSTTSTAPPPPGESPPEEVPGDEWAHAGAPAESSSDAPGRAAIQDVVAATVSGNSLTLSANPALLTGSNLHYPVYLDPSWNPNSTAPGRNAWTYVSSAFKSQSYFNSKDIARSGYNGWESPLFVARSFFQFPIPSGLWGTNIISATLQTKSVWSATNTSYSFSIYHTGAISRSTTWNAQPAKGAKITSATLPGNWRSDGSYVDKQHDFNVVTEIRNAAANRWGTVTLGLYNDTETNRNAWRKFRNNPNIAITFNSKPRIPDRYATSPAVPCNTAAAGPYPQIGNTGISFSANLSDPDGAQTQLEGQFSIVDKTAGTTLASPKVTVSNNRIALVTLPAAQFTDGHTYGWNIKASDGRDTSGATPTCQFTVNKQQPAAPAVVSTTFPDGVTGAPVGTAGVFTVTPPAGTDPPISYAYSLNTPPPATLPGGYGPFRGGTLAKAQPNLAATPITITPRHFGPNILYVYAINAAGNPGPVSTYRFTTAPPAQPARAGDFTGDGIPDHIAVGTVFKPGAWLYPGKDTAGHLDVPVQVGTDGTGGAASTFTTTDWISATVDAAEITGDGAQDLLVKLPRSDADGNVLVLPGAGDGSAFDPVDRIAIQLPRIDGEAGNQVVDQVVASPLPSVTGSPLPDLYAIIGDTLYLYPPGFPPGAYEAPIILSTGWTGRTITSASVASNPALFVRTNATGKLELYTGNTATGTPPATSGAASAVYAASGFDAASTPVIDGADINADGKPDLWTNKGQSSINGNLNTGANTLAAPVANATGNMGMVRSGVAGYCLDSKNSGSADRNVIWAWTCNGGNASQLWTVVGDGTIRINGKCLDVTGSSIVNLTPVQLYTCNGSGGQRWQPDESGALVNPQSGRCLDAPLPVGNGAQLYINNCNNFANQKWTLDATGIGAIRSAFAGKCLDNNKSLLANGNPIQLWTCTYGITSETWVLLGDGTIRVGGVYCIDVTGAGTANGTKLQLWSCNGQGQQQWRIGPNYSLINPPSGRCLDVPNSNTTDGNRLQIYDCNGGNAQVWVLP